jgi:hypothetical protein
MDHQSKNKPGNVDKKAEKNLEANLSTKGKLNFKMGLEKRNNSKFVIVRPR